jgi:PEP-CTERM motif
MVVRCLYRYAYCVTIPIEGAATKRRCFNQPHHPTGKSMKRTLFVAAALSISTWAAAVDVVIDTFDSPNVGPLTAPLGAANTVSFVDGIRSGSITTLAGPANGSGAFLTIGAATSPVGALEVNNFTGRDSEIALRWNLAPGFVPSNATNVRLWMLVAYGDSSPVDVDFSMLSLDLPPSTLLVPTKFINPNIFNTTVDFALSATEAAAVSAGGVLGVRLNGSDGWDLSVDSFGVSYDLATPVPEPSSWALGLLGGLGLAARVAVKRKKI